MLEKIASSNDSFLQVFQAQFQCGNHQLLSKASQYLDGLIRFPKGQTNCSKMTQGLPDVSAQNLHQLVSDSPWDYQALFQSLTGQVSHTMKAQKDETALLIDEVGFRKKGQHSACVSRQWLGCLGKQDNGQVAVAAVLYSGNLFCPVEAELFMSEDWEPDLDRREKTGIPEDIEHRSKPQMALQMIRHIGQNAHFDYINFDALYGCSGKVFLLWAMCVVIPMFTWSHRSRKNRPVVVGRPKCGVGRGAYASGKVPRRY